MVFPGCLQANITVSNDELQEAKQNQTRKWEGERENKGTSFHQSKVKLITTLKTFSTQRKFFMSLCISSIVACFGEESAVHTFMPIVQQIQRCGVSGCTVRSGWTFYCDIKSAWNQFIWVGKEGTCTKHSWARENGRTWSPLLPKEKQTGWSSCHEGQWSHAHWRTRHLSGTAEGMSSLLQLRFCLHVSYGLQATKINLDG